MPSFTAEDSAIVRQSSDFLGVNYYCGTIARDTVSDINDVSYYADSDVFAYADPTWMT